MKFCRLKFKIVVVQSLICAGLFETMDCSMPGFPAFTYLLEFCSNSCPLSWWCHPTISSSVTPFSSCPQSFPASGSFPVSQLFTSGGKKKYLNFSFSISPSNEYSRSISFRIDWFDLLAVQGTLKSLLQRHNLKASILSHPHMTSGKTIPLTIWTFVGKVMSLLCNTLCLS